MEEDYQFLSTFKKQIYLGKNFHTKNSVFEIEYTFFNQRNKKYVEEAYQFLPPIKKCIPTKSDKYFYTKIFSVWNWIHFFQPKEQNILGRRLSIFAIFKKCTPTKTYMPKSFSVWSWKHFLSIDGTKLILKETISFCHLSKNGFRQVLPCQKISLFEV